MLYDLKDVCSGMIKMIVVFSSSQKLNLMSAYLTVDEP
jgi:hypothetical protein